MKKFLSFWYFYKIMKNLLLVALMLVSSNIFAQDIMNDIQGKWKLQDKDTYEEWYLNDDNILEGSSFRIMQGTKVVSEYLKLFKEEDTMYYSAQVLNQNEGKAIRFAFKETKDRCTSYENPEHDFPKRIEYCFVDESTLKVNVSDMGNKGFTLLFEKL